MIIINPGAMARGELATDRREKNPDRVNDLWELDLVSFAYEFRPGGPRQHPVRTARILAIVDVYPREVRAAQTFSVEPEPGEVSEFFQTVRSAPGHLLEPGDPLPNRLELAMGLHGSAAEVKTLCRRSGIEAEGPRSEGRMSFVEAWVDSLETTLARDVVGGGAVGRSQGIPKLPYTLCQFQRNLQIWMSSGSYRCSDQSGISPEFIIAQNYDVSGAVPNPASRPHLRSPSMALGQAGETDEAEVRW